jgi:glycerophosphoryl diester phosphodiesterase
MKNPKYKIIMLLLMVVVSCTDKSTEMELDIEGHRGCRGLLPENTIPAFKKAIELGVNTLEMDLAITADSMVIVSHEPFFNHEISTHPGGDTVTAKNQMGFNIFKMNLDEVKKWDVGLKEHSRFPNQIKMAVSKPTLDEVFTMAEDYSSQLGKDQLLYNIEIKSMPQGDNLFHPEVGVFVDLVIAVVNDHQLSERVIIQSFDLRALKYTHENYPSMQLALLVDNKKNMEENINELGFIPDIYSPNFELIDENTLAYCSEKNIKLIPWTVNEVADIKLMIEKGVYGIISDYPDRAIAVWTQFKADSKQH